MSQESPSPLPLSPLAQGEGERFRPSWAVMMSFVVLLASSCLDVVEHGVSVGVTLNELDCAGASVVGAATELRFTAQSGSTILLSRTTAIGAPPRAIGVPEGSDVQLRVEAIDASGAVTARGSSVHFDVAAAQPAPQVSVALYPVDRFSRVCATLVNPRAFHTATQLMDGRVLIAGGQGSGGEALSSMEVLTGPEVLDARLLAISAQGNVFRLPRARHTATLTDSGQVVISGGESGPATLSTVLFVDPPSGFEIGALGSVPPHLPRTRHAAFKVGTQVFYVGGATSQNGVTTATAAVEQLDLTTNQMRVVLTLTEPRLGAAMTRLGSVAIIAGGLESSGASAHVELLQLISPAAPALLTLSAARTDATAIAVGGRVLVAGGLNRAGAPLASTEWLSVSPPAVQPGPAITARAELCAAALPGSRALLLGGVDANGPTAAAELVNEDSTNAQLTFPGPARHGHACLSLEDGSVLVIGGLGADGHPLDDLWRYTPQ